MTETMSRKRVFGFFSLAFGLIVGPNQEVTSFTHQQKNIKASGKILHHGSNSRLFESVLETGVGATDSIVSTVSSPGMFFASYTESVVDATANSASSSSTTTQKKRQQNQPQQERRILGSQELLMLPRQYGPSSDTFPQMNHVSCTILSETPRVSDLEIAIQDALRAHPLLRARVEGDGEPEERIDLFQMVRKGEPNPLTFVANEYDEKRDDSSGVLVKDILKVIDVAGSNHEALDASWKESFARDLDDGSWCRVDQGFLWKLELHRFSAGGAAEEGKSSSLPCAMVLSFNHAISDQSTANRLVDQILRTLAELESSKSASYTTTKKQEMPVALEDSVMGLEQRWSDVQLDGVSPGTVQYVAGKAAEGLRKPVILPDGRKEKDSGILGALSIISGRAAGGQDQESQTRRSSLQFRTLSKQATDSLLQRCRERGVSMSNALTAAIALTATDFIGNEEENEASANEKKKRNYKVLQSLDMRRFGKQVDKGETVACMAGSMDLMHGPLADKSGEAIRKGPTKSAMDQFWTLAKEGKEQTEEFINKNGPSEAVRVFDFAMTISDLNNLVHLTAKSKDTEGRAYSAGVTNVGVYERQASFEREGEGPRSTLNINHGRFAVKDVFFATPHTQSGCLYQVSCLTVGGELKMTFHPVSPIVPDKTNEKFADAFTNLLESVVAEEVTFVEEAEHNLIPENTLVLATTIVGAGFVLSHSNAWVEFFQSVAQMKANIEDPKDFWAALNFWIFFAVGHPILQPILALSDVLHGSPGPKVAGLVPATFLAGNALAIGAVTFSKQIRNALNIALIAAFFTYVGAGLDGAAGLGDFNLAIDDSYKGQIVKGCPAYDEVRQPSMDNFDLKKYQGLWYEHKFHDWTQFKEVYDTTLDIKLTDDGLGWVDDFAVKGPAPNAAKLSWEKSPVANGAHYFLFGRVDPRDPPGILRESGFGVEFPNYIVDVQKDPTTGEYKEAIQFQCLERGGVRVFEGINFMSRNQVMTTEELAAMHSRAEQAGMFPYGASPEQMHTVARKLDETPIDNNWQAMWRAIGLDKLLELLAESIEDGGR